MLLGRVKNVDPEDLKVQGLSDEKLYVKGVYYTKEVQNAPDLSHESILVHKQHYEAHRTMLTPGVGSLESLVCFTDRENKLGSVQCSNFQQEFMVMWKSMSTGGEGVIPGGVECCIKLFITRMFCMSPSSPLVDSILEFARKQLANTIPKYYTRNDERVIDGSLFQKHLIHELANVFIPFCCDRVYLEKLQTLHSEAKRDLKNGIVESIKDTVRMLCPRVHDAVDQDELMRSVQCLINQNLRSKMEYEEARYKSERERVTFKAQLTKTKEEKKQMEHQISNLTHILTAVVTVSGKHATPDREWGSKRLSLAPSDAQSDSGGSVVFSGSDSDESIGSVDPEVPIKTKFSMTRGNHLLLTQAAVAARTTAGASGAFMDADTSGAAGIFTDAGAAGAFMDADSVEFDADNMDTRSVGGDSQASSRRLKRKLLDPLPPSRRTGILAVNPTSVGPTDSLFKNGASGASLDGATGALP